MGFTLALRADLGPPIPSLGGLISPPTDPRWRPPGVQHVAFDRGNPGKKSPRGSRPCARRNWARPARAKRACVKGYLAPFPESPLENASGDDRMWPVSRQRNSTPFFYPLHFLFHAPPKPPLFHPVRERCAGPFRPPFGGLGLPRKGRFSDAPRRLANTPKAS